MATISLKINLEYGAIKVGPKKKKKKKIAMEEP
jgi:hypothetical protein